MDRCFPADQLRRLLAEELVGGERECVEAHVETCPGCQETLARLAASGHAAGPRVAVAETTERPGDDFWQRLKQAPPWDRPPASEMGRTADALRDRGAADGGGPPDVAGFEVMAELGRGGMGVVYKARQVALNRLVALKMIRDGVLAGPEQRARLRREAQAAAKVQHANIVQIFEVGEQDGQPYLVLEYIDGISLARRLDGTPLSAREAATLVAQLAQAVHAAHQQQIVHRDLKPANVLLTAAGLPKVADFGLAKQIDAAANQTQSGAILGTPSYMAPEQAASRTADVGPRTDVYALGAVLYECLTGRPPYKGPTTLETLLQVQSEEPVSPRRLQPRVPRDLETICLKCLWKDPEKRYLTAAELAEDLHRFLSGMPIRARRSGPGERSWRWCRRNPALAAMTAAIAVLLLVVTLGASLSALWLRDERDEAVKAKQDAIDKLWDSYFAQARAERLSGRPGRRFAGLKTLVEAAAIRPAPELRNEAIACMALSDLRLDKQWNVPTTTAEVGFDPALEHWAVGDKEGNVSVHRVADNEQLARLPGSGWPAPCGFSPDGRLLAVLYDLRDNNRFQILIWDWRQDKIVLKVPNAMPFNVAFSPDGRSAALAQTDKGVVLYDLAHGEQRQLFALAWGYHQLHFHPDGRKLAVGTMWGPVKIWDLDSHRVIKELRESNCYGIAWHPEGRLLATTQDRRILLWNTETWQQRAVLQGHMGQVLNLTFSHAGDLLASHSWDGTTRLWGAPGGELLLTTRTGYCRGFSSDDRRLAFSSVGEPMTAAGVWEVAAGREFRALYCGGGRGPWGMDFSPDSRLLASASDDKVRLWDPATGRQVAALPGRTRDVWFHPGGKGLITCGDSGLRYWPLSLSMDAADGELCVGPARSAGGLAEPRCQHGRLSADGRTLAVVSATSDLVGLVDIEGFKVTTQLRGHHRAHFVAPSADGKWVATATWSGVGVKVWDAHAGKVVKELPARSAAEVLFSPDGKWLVTCHAESFRLWHVGSWEPALEVPTVDRHVYGPAAFTRDGKLLAIGLSHTQVRVLNPATGKEVATLEAPDWSGAWSAGCLSFSPDGRQLAASSDRIIRVWDLDQIRQQLAAINLDFDLAPFPPLARKDPLPPLRVRVLTD